MKNTVLARRYAKALFQLAVEKNVLDTIQNEIHSFERNLEDNRDLRHFLFAQDVSRKKKKEIISTLARDRVSPIFFSFLLTLLRKNREYIFQSIAAEFKLLVDKHYKKIHALTTTALPLDITLQSQLKSILDKTFDADVQIVNNIDPTILGGLVVSVEGQVLDGSIQKQLQRLKDKLIEGSNSNHL